MLRGRPSIRLTWWEDVEGEASRRPAELVAEALLMAWAASLAGEGGRGAGWQGGARPGEGAGPGLLPREPAAAAGAAACAGRLRLAALGLCAQGQVGLCGSACMVLRAISPTGAGRRSRPCPVMAPRTATGPTAPL